MEVGEEGQDLTQGFLARVQELCDQGVTWPKLYVGKINLGAACTLDGKKRNKRVGDLLEDSTSRENFSWGGSSVNRKQVTKLATLQ